MLLGTKVEEIMLGRAVAHMRIKCRTSYHISDAKYGALHCFLEGPIVIVLAGETDVPFPTSELQQKISNLALINSKLTK